MTVTTTISRAEYNGNGSTTVFAYAFKILADSDLKVFLKTTATSAKVLKTITTHYTVSGAGSASGGNVTMGVAPASTEELIIEREIPHTQTTDYVENDAFPAETHEQALDRLVMQTQQLRRDVDRSLHNDEAVLDAVSTVLPIPVADELLAWADDGLSVTSVALVSAGVTVSDFMQTVLDDTTAAAAAETLGLGVTDSPTFTNLTLSGYLYSSIGNTITAGSTQTQAGATALAKQINRVTVSGTDGDGVKLPTAVAGSRVTVINDDAAQTIQIWPNTSDAIDGGSANAVDATALSPGRTRTYIAVDATNWYTSAESGLATPVSVANGGTGAATLTDGGLLLGSGTGAVTAMSALGDGNIVIGDGSTDPVALAAFSSSTGTLKVANGGTGASTLTDGGVLLGSGTNAVTATAVLADGEMLVGDGSTDPSIESGDTLRTSIMGAIGPDLATLGAVSSNSEFIVGTGSGAFAYESGTTLRTSVGVGTTDSPQFTSLTLTGFEYLSMTTGITAGTTQSQAGATALTTQTNRVTVSGTDADAVKLPTAVANALVTIINDDAAQTIAVWPNTGDTIDGGSANAVDSNTLAAGNSRTYLAYDATNWVTVTNPASAGFSFANDSNNRVTTGTGSGGINGEANLTFDGSTLTVSGTASLDGAVTINDTGAAVDFRVESDTVTTAAHLDSSLNGGHGAWCFFGIPTANESIRLDRQALTIPADIWYTTVSVSRTGAVTVPTGTATFVSSLYVAEPAITATGTVTYATSLFVGNQPTEGTNNSAARFDGDVLISHTNGQATLFIGPTTATNAGMAAGITIDQTGSDDEILALKSSGDIAHGMTSISETDTFGRFQKYNGNDGGMVMEGLSEQSIALVPRGNGTATDTTDNSTAVAPIYTISRLKSGTSITAYGSSDNIFIVTNNTTTKFLIKGDGNIHGDTGATALDAYDDAALIRASELERTIDKGIEDQVLPSRFDANKYDKETLEEMHLRCARISDEDWESGTRPLYSITNMNDLVKGAIWQNHEMMDALMEAVDEALTDAGLEDNFQQTYVKPRFVARGLPTQILDWDGPIPDDLTVNHEPPPAFNE